MSDVIDQPDDISWSLRLTGDAYFDSSRAWRMHIVMLALAEASIAASALALVVEYRHDGATDGWTVLALVVALGCATIVSSWALYVRDALLHIIARATGPLTIRWAEPRAFIRRVREVMNASVLKPKNIPLTWRSPLATTLWRLRLALLVILALFGWSIIDTGAAIATPVLTWAPVVSLSFGCAITLFTLVPFILTDIARRRFREADIASLLEPSTPNWPVRIVSLVLAVTFLVLSIVQLAQRAIPLVEDATHLSGRATTSVELPKSTQTIYTGCSDDLNCSPLEPSEIRVTSFATHVRLEVTDDQGVDHESFDGHPWLSVANVRVPTAGRYLVTLGGSAHGQYRMALSQSAIFRAVLPLIITVLWRMTALWLGGVALYETFFFRRRRTPTS